jgi:hypothetical protein
MVPARLALPRREHLFIQPEVTGVSFDSLEVDRSPEKPVDETLGIPSTNLATFPSVLHPEGLRFLGVRPVGIAHCTNPTKTISRKQEIRISKLTGILD